MKCICEQCKGTFDLIDETMYLDYNETNDCDVIVLKCSHCGYSAGYMQN